MTSLLEWLSGGTVSRALTVYPVLYMLVNAAHILSIGLLVGTILPLDLRLLGLFKRTPLQLLGPFLSRTAATGAVLAILTGMLLFTVRASEYVANPAFLTKMGLLACRRHRQRRAAAYRVALAACAFRGQGPLVDQTHGRAVVRDLDRGGHRWPLDRLHLTRRRNERH
ncbi:hypothetical protein [Halotalea alkalilenta]|uniref:hypothetical protein n=1 Tax=Halotalea alkalilenta TaxID=376489 RepID=UPI001B80B47E|nr:hypothetical protein [Halotalea alkalilenta]